MRHLLSMRDLSAADVAWILAASEIPAPGLLENKGVALYFEKPSLRTRHSAEMAVVQLGGHPVTIRREEIGAGAREPLSDIARVLAGYHALMGARVFVHDDVVALAAAGALPMVQMVVRPLINLPPSSPTPSGVASATRVLSKISTPAFSIFLRANSRSFGLISGRI